MKKLDNFEDCILLGKSVSDLYEAILLADKNGLMRLTADDLTWGHSTGVIEDKGKFVNNIVSRVFCFTAINIEGQTIDLLDNTRVVRHVMFAETDHVGERKSSIRIGIVLVWCRRFDKGWQLLARQAYKF